MKSNLPIVSFLVFAFFTFNARASTIGLTVSNYEDPANDFLFADSSGVILPSGIATMGYFPGGFSVSTDLSVSVLIDNFTVAASQTIGSSIEFGMIPGYALPPPDMTGGGGRLLYLFLLMIQDYRVGHSMVS